MPKVVTRNKAFAQKGAKKQSNALGKKSKVHKNNSQSDTIFHLSSALHEWYRPNFTDIGTTVTAFDTGSIGGMDIVNPSAGEEPTLDANYCIFDGVGEAVKKDTSNFRGSDITGCLHFKFYHNSGVFNTLFSTSNSSVDDEYFTLQIRDSNVAELQVNYSGVYGILRCTNTISNGINTVSFYCTGADNFIILNGLKQTSYSFDNVAGRWIKYFIATGGNSYQNISLGSIYRSSVIYRQGDIAGGWYCPYVNEATSLSEHNYIRNNALPI